jgi:O-antigen ligase
MPEALSMFIMVGAAIAAALMAALGMAGAVHVTSRQPHGYLHFIFYAMLLVVALTSVLSGRELGAAAVVDASVVSGRSPIMKLIQPMVSLMMLAVAGERIISHWLSRSKTTVHAPPFILIAFVMFWFGTVASPALLGTNPDLSHDFAYALVIGVAAALSTGIDRDLALKATRNALVIFMLISLLLIPVKPSLVMDLTYSQGVLPGVPRLAGLSPHAVSMGLLSQLGLLCLLARPYDSVWGNRLAWLVGLSVLLLAQSKTAWVAFIVCSACILMITQGPRLWKSMGDTRRPEFGIASVLGFMVVVLAISLVLMFGNIDARLNNFFESAQGAQLATLTGRDRIWVIAYDEWQRSPIFGYGPNLWDKSYRLAIGLPNATHAHNQFMDTLSRSGIVGASALVMYSLVLLGMSIRYAGASGGLSLGLFMALFLRAISEVPLLMFGYGAELIIHVLLLVTLAASAHEARLAERTKERMRMSNRPVFTSANPLTTARSRL